MSQQDRKMPLPGLDELFLSQKERDDMKRER